MSTDFRAVLLAAEVREIERRYTSQATRPGLMDRAGLAAAELARLLLGEKDRRIAIVAGPGNNGGDALVAARYLKQWWFDVVLIYAGDDTKKPADARTALSAWLQAGGR